ncbi:MAG: hypothetical protein V4548_03605 [Bacteroidota bacterium]
MRNITIFSLLVGFINLSFCQTKFDESMLIEEYQKIDAEISLSIVRSVEKDTVYGLNYLNIKEYYNSKNQIVKKIKGNNEDSLYMTGNRTELYKNEKLVVTVNQDIGEVIWALEILNYDSDGALIRKDNSIMKEYTELLL